MRVLNEIYVSIFEDEVKEVRYIIEQTKTIPLDFRLSPKTRTILELVNHVVQIPRIDIGIYSGELNSGELAHEMELKLNKDNIDDALKVFDDGCNYLRKFFEKMNDEDLMTENLVAFYEQDPKPKAWTHYLAKLITHLVLHKGVIWSYLKVADVDVDMFTYYGMKTPEKLI
ncbi:MAG: DinB family protein [Candidatus Thorarchaeota archaeon]